MVSRKYHVVMLDPLSKEEEALANEILSDTLFRVSYCSSPDGSVDSDTLSTADVIVTKTRAVTADTIAASPNLKLVQKYGGRPDRLDLEAAERADVAVAVMPLRGCIAVAELTMTLILALSKQLIAAHDLTIEGAYQQLGIEPKLTSQRVHAFQWMKLPLVQEINGKTLGLVGFGEIGTEVARRARAFGMNVLYHKRESLPRRIEENLEVKSSTLEKLLAASDFVSLHVPHGEETNRLIGAEQLQLMKSSAYLINTCRGPVVDEAALIHALETKTIAGAGLDVFEFEPLPVDSRLIEMENVILTPHIGGGSGGAREKQLTDVLSNVVRFADGQIPHHRVA